MIAAVTVAGVLAAGAMVLAWRRARLAAHPEAWPPGLSFSRQLRLTRAYLKQDGWKLLEPQPAWNIFVRAQKDRMGLALMLHTEETLSLPTLMKDCITHSAPSGLIMGILSQQSLQPEFQADAARNGIYVVNPADLPDIATHVRRATLRQKEIKAAGLAPIETVGRPSMSKAVSA